jgi:uncharacterized protein
MSLRKTISFLVLFSFFFATAFAGDKDFPPKPSPARLVNDLAHMMNDHEQSQLEHKLLEYEINSSTQITVVTITNLGGYEVAQYAIELGNRWGVGQKGKDNGVLVLAAKDDRKVWITTGYGLEGVLTDATAGKIYRNEIVPYFKQGKYYEGFSQAADAIIAVTKGEYTADEKDRRNGDKRRMPAAAIIIIILVVYFVLWILGKIGGGGGSYMSGRGHRGWGGGPWIGGGGFGGGNWGGGGSSGGFGGFGGGSFGGGGAGGSW